MIHFRIRLALLAACIYFLYTVQCGGAEEQHLRLYVLDCGTIEGITATMFGFDPREIKDPRMASPCFLVVHPKGTLMWEAGELPDSQFGPGRGPIKEEFYIVRRPLLPQLAAVGYDPQTITYFAMSHYHSDHTANANAFANSIWLVQSADYLAMFADPPPKSARPDSFAELKAAQKTIIETREFDVFGDESVVLLSTPGHTEGHQVLFIKLLRTGAVILSGDLYHYSAERAAGRVPVYTLNGVTFTEWDPAALRASRLFVENYAREHNAQIWIQHDYDANAARKLAPAFYE